MLSRRPMAASILAFIVAAVADPSLAASADKPVISPAMLAYVAEPDHRAAVVKAALDGFKYRHGECPSAVIAKILPITPFAKPEAASNADGALTQGGIKEPMLVSGCGKTSLENIITAVVAGGITRTIFATPGTTKGDLLLAKDTMPYLAMYMRVKGPKDCRDERIMNTRFDDFEGPPTPTAKFQADGGRPYREIWTVSACGTPFDIPVHYIPDATGTLINVQIDR